jgi:ubiquinone/menaquinone biosynthesis C-methylase UbiE
MPHSFDWRRITPNYAQVYDDFRGGYSPETIAYIVQRAQIYSASSRVLDLACGTGAVFRELVGYSRVLIGMDAAWPMLAQSGSLYLGRVPNLSLARSVGENLALESGCIDLVSIGQAIHWFNLPALFSELQRVLRPGGWIVVLCRYPSPAGQLEALSQRIQYRFSQDGSEGIPKWTSMNAPENLLGLEKAGFSHYERRVFSHEIPISIDGYLRGMVERSKSHEIKPEALPSFQAQLSQELKGISKDGMLCEPFFDYVFMAQKD